VDTFRHTCASTLFHSGWNAVQVQKFLGHHKASFTLDTYIHLLEEDIPEPVEVAIEVSTGTAESSRSRDDGCFGLPISAVLLAADPIRPGAPPRRTELPARGFPR
jgi:hypothetical protein